MRLVAAHHVAQQRAVGIGKVAELIRVVEVEGDGPKVRRSRRLHVDLEVKPFIGLQAEVEHVAV